MDASDKPAWLDGDEFDIPGTIDPEAPEWREHFKKERQGDKGETVCGGKFRLKPASLERAVEKEDKNGNVVTRWVYVCGRLEVLALSRDGDGDEWGRALRFKDGDGTAKEMALPVAALAGDGGDARRALMTQGLHVSTGRKQREWLTEYLNDCRPTERIRCAPITGWHGPTFVLPPSRNYGDGERVVYQSPRNLTHAYRQQGTLQGWQENVARYAVGNSRLALGISTAFAAPLLLPTATESGGVHFRGGSAIGKTTLMQVAASVCGSPSYMRQWRATANGLESIMALHCDTLLCLDELGQVSAREAGHVAYMLSNGRGKSRADRAGAARPALEWRTLFLSTGEISLAQKMAECGDRARAGQEVRVIDLPADAGAGLGLFEHLHGFASAKAFAEHLQVAAARYHGTALDAYLSRLDAGEAVRLFQDVRTRFDGCVVPPNADGQVSRCARRFALVTAAGELATRMGVLPWPEGEATRAATACFAAWLAGRGGSEPAEVRQGIDQVRLFLEQHGASRFEAAWALGANDLDRTINRAGFRRADNESGGWEYFILPTVWREEVCKGLDAGLVAKALADRGWLARGNGKTAAVVHVPGTGSVRVYHITANFFCTVIQKQVLEV